MARLFYEPRSAGPRKDDTSPDAAFKRLIDHSSQSVYGAFYDISDETIAARLVDAGAAASTSVS